MQDRKWIGVYGCSRSLPTTTGQSINFWWDQRAESCYKMHPHKSQELEKRALARGALFYTLLVCLSYCSTSNILGFDMNTQFGTGYLMDKSRKMLIMCTIVKIFRRNFSCLKNEKKVDLHISLSFSWELELLS